MVTEKLNVGGLIHPHSVWVVKKSTITHHFILFPTRWWKAIKSVFSQNYCCDLAGVSIWESSQWVRLLPLTLTLAPKVRGLEERLEEETSMEPAGAPAPGLQADVEAWSCFKCAQKTDATVLPNRNSIVTSSSFSETHYNYPVESSPVVPQVQIFVSLFTIKKNQQDQRRRPAISPPTNSLYFSLSHFPHSLKL